ncbi:Guanylate cyclase [Seminavis robusta]|uniref:Guanylate cyclase n=1 Tax=Seminavis robusta TaxID=568900 RepID=A0A9N8DR38_9STRA|nr:Guanylate cyclase [Seminavis robusta]|eukprot:Sro290_g109310.1 Guanylate cyclase (727) ;mRNA; f:38709-40889
MDEVVMDAPVKKECSIFMAPSSLKGLQGYGIFTTRDIDELESILQAPDGPSIVVTDFRTQQNKNESKEMVDFRRHWTHMWDHYWWGRGVGDHASYEAEYMIDFQPTFGALPNHHCLWNTITFAFPKVPYLDHLTNSSSVGAGAFSYHAGRDFRVKKPLPAGSEIFLNYGHCDRTDVDHSTPQWTKYSKMKQDYLQAAKLVMALWNALFYYEPTGTVREEYHTSFLQHQQQHQRSTNNNNNNYVGRNMMDLPLVEGILYVSGILKEEESHPVRSLIPSSTGELFRVMEPFLQNNENNDLDEGTDRFRSIPNVKPMALAEQLERILGTNPRTPEWIQQHGMCLENLIPKPSTLPQAGQGGFAQHSIAKGEIVVPAPTLHILHKGVLAMTNHHDNHQQQQQQLLLNYCWGNTQTTLLVCPITNAQLINHCSDRPGFPCPKLNKGSGNDTSTSTSTGPNARIEWADSSWDPSTREWLNMTIPQMMQQPLYQRGLSLQVVATRDILPGEEVFVDYGQDWEHAWIRHVIDWSHNDDDSGGRTKQQRRSVAQLNQAIEKGQPLDYLVANDLWATDDAGQDDYLMTVCMYETSEQDEDDAYQIKVDGNWRRVYADEDELLEAFADSGEDYVYSGGYSQHDEGIYWPCTVLRREEDNDDSVTYTVRIHASPIDDDDKSLAWHENNLPRMLTSYPLASIRYFPRMYHSDQHLVHAFRHPMGLPDNMIPDRWKTLDA